MDMPIEGTPDQLATAANERLTVAHLFAPRITAKERKGASAGPRPMIGANGS